MAGRPRKNTIVMKELECGDCGTLFCVPRRLGRNKMAGHKKKLWCYRCKKRTVHIEKSDEGTIINRRR